MKKPRILIHPLNKSQTDQLAKEFVGDKIKIAIDVEDRTVAAGGTLHTDVRSLLLKHGSKQKNIWGVDFYPERESGNRLDYTALINERPREGNPSQVVSDPDVRKKIQDILNKYFEL